MHVTRHRDLDAFIAAVAPMKARGEASASFFTGGAHAMKRTPPRAGERIYLATCRGRAAFGVAMLRDAGPLLIGESDAAAAAAFAVDLARDWPELQGVVGAPAGCEAFARQVEGSHRARPPLARSHAPARAVHRQRRARGTRKREDGHARRRGLADRAADRVHRRSGHSRSARARARAAPFAHRARGFPDLGRRPAGRLRGLQRRGPGLRADRPCLHAAGVSRLGLRDGAGRGARRASCWRAASASSSSRPTLRIPRRMRFTRGSDSAPRTTIAGSISSRLTAHQPSAWPRRDSCARRRSTPGSRARRSSSTPAPPTTPRACCALPSATR